MRLLSAIRQNLKKNRFNYLTGLDLLKQFFIDGINFCSTNQFLLQNDITAQRRIRTGSVIIYSHFCNRYEITLSLIYSE